MSQVSAIEDFLIQAGVARNQNLQNVKGTNTPKWQIAGVVRAGKGRSSHAAASFARLMGISKR